MRHNQGDTVLIEMPNGLNLKTMVKGYELFTVTEINGDGSLQLVGIDFPKTKHLNCKFSIPATAEELEKIGVKPKVIDAILYGTEMSRFFYAVKNSTFGKNT